MLAECRAFAVAHTEAQNRTLVKLGERAGFGMVGTVLGERRVVIEAARGEIVYFLLHYRLSDEAMRAIIRRIRDSETDAIRYAPICLIIDDCPFETVLKYVHFGFDDVIPLPEKREILVGRLVSQLETEHVYYETADYLGPDRRRLELSPADLDDRRTGTTPHTRLIIHRSLATGVRLLRREMISGTPRRPVELRPRAAAG